MLTRYLEELQKVHILGPDEERLLWRRFRVDGDADSRLRLIEAYQPLVFKVVMQLRPPDGVLLDMLQEGTVGLIEAVERFDPGRGVRFSTFATYRIRGRVLNALRRGAPAAYSLEQDGLDDLPLATRLADPDSDRALADVEDGAVLDQLRRAMDALPARERAILRGTYLESRHPRHLARELRISLSHFYRLHRQALDRVRALVGADVHTEGKVPGY
ncbi:MAG: sigma-70 family RNA polymerase sigma factor [Armatimonadota bacterium]|nr:sigma-70 family RNA polymerase sigma factor [Armatimonadota bacterium]MDR7401494.1 sigma-70 family RNA polymerase sigma factor [Armatimonadota bacterium]MDR7404755.1 sigma-70 family RNA polymerase sigma factor [Armatimonadota bacterium]MDR7437533.1 sigma-70 family RNA polymerase sigma factor [Armatimonadota bacterium]MDR7471698.1 sigma-70 family RNA polymerase sigma factor [Armatimonadota bacterium]